MKEADPGARAAIGEERELRLHRAHAGGVGAEMADAGNEIAERQTPMAHSREPGVRLLHVLFGDVHIAAVAVDQFQPERAAQGVAEVMPHRLPASAAPKASGREKLPL